ncbi:signal recognition particle subunit SRP72-like [Lytechinus variegatus]|uniref:signal recognition particle subunit SRP72-like n=1 Tax=Lytechinus variegatus TaxID=7654 RepID=UPI001BB19D40|nr:signal recognition particle subunit SRP72-like [Lytechinus variegatus]
MSKQKTPEVNLANLYHELNKFAQNADYSNPRALNVANKILKANRGDETAFQCKIICLIHQTQFQIALKEIVNNPNVASGLSFEKAYCQYRLNKIPEALSTIRNVSDPSPKLQELLGQVLYRLEQYSECVNVYKNLIKNTSDDYEEERQTNLSAVIAGLKLWENKDVDDPGLEDETWELSFNRACLLIGQGNYPEALAQLVQAEKLCREMMEEDDDVEAELGIIYVQRAYVLQLQGMNDEAIKLYNQVVKARPSDIGLMAVASANIISLNKDQNVFDSKKKVKATMVSGLENKLTKGQKSLMSYNRFLLLLYTNQFEQCRKLLSTMKSDDYGEEMLCLLQASLFCRQKQIPKAVQVIQDFVSSHDNVGLPTQLTVAQLFLLQGNISKACDVLQSLDGSSHRPAIVSTLVALYVGMENGESAIGVLDEAVNWYKQYGGPQNELNILLRENTAFKLKRGQSQAATSMLEDLRRSNPGDIKTLAQLISAYSKFDPKRAQELSKELPSVAQLSADVDVDVLENTPLTLSTRQLKKGGKTDGEKTGAVTSVEEMKKKRKRKRKPQLPKNFDSSVAPDPERWLPMRERSYFKGKRRRDKKGGVGKGTQGATAGSGDMDASKPSSVPNSPRPGSQTSSNTASPSPANPTPRQQKPASAAAKKNKAKKKRGGKW